MISIDFNIQISSLYVKESEFEILERSDSEILEIQSQKFWKGQIFYLQLRNPVWN